MYLVTYCFLESDAVRFVPACKLLGKKTYLDRSGIGVRFYTLKMEAFICSEVSVMVNQSHPRHP